jgi:hypothetical protein
MSDVKASQPTAEYPVNFGSKVVVCRDVTDSLGRKLRINKLDLLSEMDLIEAAGPDASGNPRWMMLATLACCINEINGVTVIFPNNRGALRKHVEKAGAEGVAAVASAFRADLPDEDATDADAGIAKN